MKETTELVLFLAAVASQVVESSQDEDGLKFDDAGSFIDELLQAPEALKGISKIADEVKNSDYLQRAKLYETVSNKVQDITPDNIDKLVRAAETIAYALDTIVVQFRGDKRPVALGPKKVTTKPIKKG